MLNISFIHFFKPKTLYIFMVFFRSSHQAPHSHISPTLGLFYVVAPGNHIFQTIYNSLWDIMVITFITINFME